MALTKTEKKLLARLSLAKIFVNPLGVDTDFLIKESKIAFPKNPNILFIANFSAHKRFELLLDAFIKLHQNYPTLTFTALGQKTLYWPKIQTKIDSLPVKINIIFNPTPQEIKQSIDNSTLLCLPSVHESFGLVFIESLARGKPGIGADTPQTAEVIKTIQGGLTFKTDNLSDLISQIKFLIDNPKKAQQLGLDGYRYVKNHLTWDRIGKSLWSKIS
jgi:glycosyltransferase involved in cell wall biosynthesis